MGIYRGSYFSFCLRLLVGLLMALVLNLDSLLVCNALCTFEVGTKPRKRKTRKTKRCCVYNFY